MIFLITYLLSGYMAYWLFMKKLLYVDNRYQNKMLIRLLLTGYFGLGYVIGKYYQKL